MRTLVALSTLGFAVAAACGGTIQGVSGEGGATDRGGRDAPTPDAAIRDGASDVTAEAASTDGACGSTYGPGVCGAKLCGNGVIDSCQECEPGKGGGGGGGTAGGPPGFGDACATVSEACDGTDLGGKTCAGLGYAGGSLACTPACTLDASVCSTCAPTVRGMGCPLAPQAEGVSVAATATEIGLVWIAHGGGCQGVRFDRYGTDLTRISESVCLSSCDAVGVAVAPTPTGWLVASAVHAGLELISLDAMGAPRGTPRTIAGAYAPIFAANPGGAPLLMWAAGADFTGGAYVALLGDDGTELHPHAQAFSGTVEPYRGDAIFVGDGFLVGERAMIGRDTIGVRHVALDGSLGTTQSPAPGYAEYPQLAWTGSEARLTYAQFSSAKDGVYWTRLDGTGATLGSPVLLSAYPTAYQRTPIVAKGSDSLALTGPGPGMGGLALVHVSTAGVVSAPKTIVLNAVAEQKMVLTGSAILEAQPVAAWLEECGQDSLVQDAPGNLMGRAALAAVGP